MTKNELIKWLAKDATVCLRLAILVGAFCFFFRPGLVAYGFLRGITNRTDLDDLSADWKIVLEDVRRAK